MDAFDIRLGPLSFVNPLDTVGETAGDGLETVGAALVAADRKPRPLKLKLPVRGLYGGSADPAEQGRVARRQVRALFDNAAWRLQGFYFVWDADPDLDAWLLVGGGDLSEADPGISFGEFELDLSDVYIVGRPGTHRPGRRALIADRRSGLVPRDSRQLLYSTDFASQALPDEPLMLPGDIRGLTATGNRPVASTLAGAERDGRRLWLAAAAADGDVLSYRPDPDVLADRSAYLDLEALGAVRVFDLSGATTYPPEPADYTADGDSDPTVYGWEQVMGDVLTPDRPLAIENGVVRLIWLGAGADEGLALEYWDSAAGHYLRAGRVLHALEVDEQRVVEVTPERAVLEWRAGEKAMRAILQRGWWGPRLESYSDGGGTARLEYAPDGGGTIGATPLDPEWVWSVASERTDPTFEIPPGSLDRWFAYIGDPARSASERRDLVAFGDSTTYGSGGFYSWLQRLRDRFVAAGIADGGKGFFGSGEHDILYDAPEINGFVSTTFSGPNDEYDTADGEFWGDDGSVANRTLTLQFKGTAFRIWYSRRPAVGSFTYAVDGGAPVRVDAYLKNPIALADIGVAYVGGLADTTHTVVITNLGGRPAEAPASIACGDGGPGSGTFTAQTLYYKATYVFGGGESTPSPVGSVVVGPGNRRTTIQVPNVGQDSTKIYRSTSSSGPFELVAGAVFDLSTADVVQYHDDAAFAVSSGVTPPSVMTSNLNTSAKQARVGFSGFRSTGLTTQKQARSGATMGSFAATPGGPDLHKWKAAEALGLRLIGSDLEDPASYEVDPTLPVAGRVKPILAILDLGFNDLSSQSSSDVSHLVRGVDRFGAICEAAGCDGIVVAGNFWTNSHYATYGALYKTTLKDAAVANGLAYVDFGDGPFTSSERAAITNPHLGKTDYQKQADWLWDEVLSVGWPIRWASGTADELVEEEGEVIDGQAVAWSRDRVLVAQLALPPGPDAGELASLSLVDARPVPVLVARS